MPVNRVMQGGRGRWVCGGRGVPVETSPINGWDITKEAINQCSNAYMTWVDFMNEVFACGLQFDSPELQLYQASGTAGLPGPC